MIMNSVCFAFYFKILENKVMDEIRDQWIIQNLEDEDIVKSGDIEIECLFTPGHWSDHMCYLLKRPGTPTFYNCKI